MIEPSSPKKRTTLYIEPNIHKAYKQICDREGISMSKKTETQWARIVAAHLPGNPQLVLETFGAVKQGTCYSCEKILPDHQLRNVEFISDLKAKLCQQCLKQERDKGRFSTIRKVGR